MHIGDKIKATSGEHLILSWIFSLPCDAPNFCFFFLLHFIIVVSDIKFKS